MSGIESGVNAAISQLETIEKGREAAMACSRRVIRLSKKVIHAIHDGEPVDEPLDQMRLELDAMKSHCSTPEVLMSGPVQDAMGEYAEAEIMSALASGDVIPDHIQLGIGASPWIQGFCDCAGELRRMVMTRLAEGDLDGAKGVFSIMEEVHEEIQMLDVPDAIAPVRRKQDIARGLMDKTRSEMTLASIMSVR